MSTTALEQSFAHWEHSSPGELFENKFTKNLCFQICDVYRLKSTTSNCQAVHKRITFATTQPLYFFGENSPI